MKSSRIRKTGQSSKSILRAAALATPAVLAIAQAAHATTYYWDINGTAAAGASATTGAGGTWNTTNTFWNTDSAGGAGTLVADPGTGNDVVIAAGGATVAAGNATGTYTVTVSNSHTVDGITFNTGTVALNGGTIELTNGANIVTGGLTAGASTKSVIRSVIKGTNGINFSQVGTTVGGTMTLTASNTFTGTVNVQNRVNLFITNGQALGQDAATN